jgi:hypothetical protein
MSGERKASSHNGLRISTPPIGHHLPTDACQIDPDLVAVIEAWNELPKAVRASIMMLVQAAKGND